MRLHLLLFISLLCLGSCISKKKLEYLQNEDGYKISKIAEGGEIGVYNAPKNHLVKPNDDLIINVSSFDDNSFNYFREQSNNRTLQASNEMSINVMSYTVDVEGYIAFPVVGKILVGGLELEGVREKLSQLLTPYFNQPNVTVKFAFKKITVLGEVNSPGYYTYTKDQITIFDALAMASDLTIHGDRKEVVLIRNIEDKANKYVIDLTDDAQVFGYNYYLQPEDVIYVKPRGSAKWREITVPITLVFTTITTALLVLNAVRN